MCSQYEDLSCDFLNLFTLDAEELLQPSSLNSIKNLSELTGELVTFYSAFNRIFNANMDTIKSSCNSTEGPSIVKRIYNSICKDCTQSLGEVLTFSDIPISLYVACELDFIPINFIKMIVSKGFTKLYLLFEPSDRLKSTLDAVKSMNRFFSYKSSNPMKTPFDANYLVIVKETKDLDEACINWNIDRGTNNVIIYKHYENLFSYSNKKFFSNDEVIDFETYNKVKCRASFNPNR